ncbi:MAG: DUF2807 domain-containing protein [Muribaculaceae bacterium]|nr:DUF2807 domain-containing protein [Muribaculaceae bacterium]
MKKCLTLIVALMAMLAWTAGAQQADYKLNVQNFCELTVVDGVRVDYYCMPDSAGWAVFSCEPELASHIMFDNTAEHLVIQTDADESPIVGLPRVTVYSASLRKVENSGDSLLRVYADIPVKEFKVRLIGNGTIELHKITADKADIGIAAGNGTVSIDGSTGKLTARNVSAGRIDASGLLADEARCFVFGTGNIHCNAPGRLKVFGAGSGIVYYHGAAPSKITNRGLGVKSMAYDKAPAGDRLLSIR